MKCLHAIVDAGGHIEGFEKRKTDMEERTKIKENLCTLYRQLIVVRWAHQCSADKLRVAPILAHTVHGPRDGTNGASIRREELGDAVERISKEINEQMIRKACQFDTEGAKLSVERRSDEKSCQAPTLKVKLHHQKSLNYLLHELEWNRFSAAHRKIKGHYFSPYF